MLYVPALHSKFQTFGAAVIKKLDRYIFFRLLGITLFVLGALVFIFIVIHFSDHSEEFTDRGATIAQILGTYYLNYIPEMVRLVSPVAVFVACLYLTGQMADRLEIIALKAAGVSLYRLLAPYLVFGLIVTCAVSYLDAYIVPDANQRRMEFANKYLNTGFQTYNRSELYRQISPSSVLQINYYDKSEAKAYDVDIVHFSGDSIAYTASVQKMIWSDSLQKWRFYQYEKHNYGVKGYTIVHTDSIDTTLNISPRDLARTTSDIYQLTWPEAQNFIHSLQQSGATSVDAQKVEFYGRLTYPWSAVIVIIIGFAVASQRRKVGKGFYIAAGLLTSFIYLAMMKIIEPFGAEGVISPVAAAVIPHLFFLVVGVGLLLAAKK